MVCSMSWNVVCERNITLIKFHFRGTNPTWQIYCMHLGDQLNKTWWFIPITLCGNKKPAVIPIHLEWWPSITTYYIHENGHFWTDNQTLHWNPHEHIYILYIPIISQEIPLNFIFFLKPKLYEWEVIFPKTSWAKGQNDDPKYPHLLIGVRKHLHLKI